MYVCILQRFAMGGGRSGGGCSALISELCVAALQHCSVHEVFAYVAGCRQQQYGTCSPACMLNAPLLPLLLYAWM
jgi:hypothetical protein